LAEPLTSRRVSPALILSLMGAAALVCIVLFLTLGARGSWSFVLPYRGMRLAALVVVAAAVSISTVLFQTVTNNRILTPSIMGFDSLFVLIQTCILFFFGAIALSGLDPRLLFMVQVAVMAGFSILLYKLLFSGGMRSLHLMLLVGVVFGVFFRSLSGLMQRLMDPNEFVVLQDRLFASFNTVDPQLLGISAVVLTVVSVLALRNLSVLDVLALGRDTSIGLGVDHRRAVRGILLCVALLVAISTALVGPVTFFGLLVANLAYLAIPSHRHRHVVPAAVLISIICLVGGQMIVERLFAFDTALSIVIEFAGGIMFIIMLLRGAAR
jgi:iron complex transport system permease protein